MTELNDFFYCDGNLKVVNFETHNPLINVIASYKLPFHSLSFFLILAGNYQSTDYDIPKGGRGREWKIRTEVKN